MKKSFAVYVKKVKLIEVEMLIAYLIEPTALKHVYSFDLHTIILIKIASFLRQQDLYWVTIS